MRLLPLIFATTLLGGCSLVPDYFTPMVDMPTQWQEETAAERDQCYAITKTWWKKFGSSELDLLVAQAMSQNTDIQAAIARVEQAKAQLKISGASLLPTLDATGNISDRFSDGGGSSNSISGFGTGTTGTGTSGSTGSFRNSSGGDSYNAQLSVAYELDLFGKNRAAREQAAEQFRASRFDRESITLSTTAEVANAYFNLLSLRERVATGERNLKNTKEVLRILEARFKEGAVSQLEVSQQRTSYGNTEASLSQLRQQESVATHQLALLLGRSPKSLMISGKDLSKLTLPKVAHIQPAELITRRPDIAAAEAQLKAANANIGAARAAYFPSLNLSLDSGFSASPIDDASQLATSIAAAVIAPIFEGGRLEGGVELSKAQKEELAASYRKVVLTAFKEVEDALSGVRNALQREAALGKATKEAGTAYRVASERYKAGAIDFTTLLTTQQSKLQADDTYIASRNDLLAATTALYKAYGGGWVEKD